MISHRPDQAIVTGGPSASDIEQAGREAPASEAHDGAAPILLIMDSDAPRIPSIDGATRLLMHDDDPPAQVHVLVVNRSVTAPVERWAKAELRAHHRENIEALYGEHVLSSVTKRLEESERLVTSGLTVPNGVSYLRTSLSAAASHSCHLVAAADLRSHLSKLYVLGSVGVARTAILTSPPAPFHSRSWSSVQVVGRAAHGLGRRVFGLTQSGAS